MPYSTFGYGFEWKAHAFAAGLARQLAGTERATFVLTLDGQGSATGLWFAPPQGQPWHQWIQELGRDGVAYLFFDPFDAPEYTWLAWSKVSRATLERLVGAPFLVADFERVGVKDAPELPQIGQFPDDWGVMF